MNKGERIVENAELIAKAEFGKLLINLDKRQLHYAVSRAVTAEIQNNWCVANEKKQKNRRAFYFSAEFLMGKMIYNNLLCLGVQREIENALSKRKILYSVFEDIPDSALGNGGLGRLAACYLDSAATVGLPLDGYGIRYKYGLFKQKIKNGFQEETADDWGADFDPWSVRKDGESVTVKFRNFSVTAVPYDMPIIGYKSKAVGTLRLWQSEPETEFCFEKFNNGDYSGAVKEKTKAENISAVLYPNDEKTEGKLLRLEQQYFFCSASLQDILRRYEKDGDRELTDLADYVTVQLNDTHPVISIPELIRLLMLRGLSFNRAFDTAKEVFNYTNHTILPEALEKWDIKLMRKILPETVSIIKKIDRKFKKEAAQKDLPDQVAEEMAIINGDTVNMAYLACYCSKHINGVAKIHTDILKSTVLKNWYNIYPERFLNVTNGITQRRFLALCNPQLSALITELSGSDKWITKLPLLKDLERFADDREILDRFYEIKQNNKTRLKDYILRKENILINENTVFDIQIKRLHEYKRQLLNILTVLELYYRIKEGSLPDFAPTTFIFGAKSAPGYRRAKAIIKLINSVAELIEKDDAVNQILKVVFVSDYNVSYAEKIIAAADVSEQISTAGTEASGTGNMKLMLNGAVTLGTLDGANVEIVKSAGEDNNYIFGARVDELEEIKEKYDPNDIYNSNTSVKRCLDSLIDGTLPDGGTGYFRELYDSILKGESWHRPDNYFLLLDFEDYLNTRIRLNNDYKNKYLFLKKCWINMCNAGEFSADRAVRQYAKEIWDVKKIK